MAMNWKQIETSREARLWLGQIIVPLATVVMMTNPETRKKVFDGVSNGATKVKNTVVDGFNKIRKKFKKEEMEEVEVDPCMGCYYKTKPVCASDCIIYQKKMRV